MTRNAVRAALTLALALSTAPALADALRAVKSPFALGESVTPEPCIVLSAEHVDDQITYYVVERPSLDELSLHRLRKEAERIDAAIAEKIERIRIALREVRITHEESDQAETGIRQVLIEGETPLRAGDECSLATARDQLTQRLVRPHRATTADRPPPPRIPPPSLPDDPHA